MRTLASEGLDAMPMLQWWAACCGEGLRGQLSHPLADTARAGCAVGVVFENYHLGRSTPFEGYSPPHLHGRSVDMPIHMPYTIRRGRSQPTIGVSGTAGALYLLVRRTVRPAASGGRGRGYRERGGQREGRALARLGTSSVQSWVGS